MVATGIRKVAVPIRQQDPVKELAWRSRVSRSQVIRDVIEEYVQNPAAYRALPDMDGLMSGTVTVYVPDDIWYAARDIAYADGRTPISVIIRKGLRARMEAETIPAEA